MRDALVIGAGMAGLTAARELSRAGLSVAVVEARERLGGRVWSIRDFCETPVEAGAEFVHGVRAATWPEVRAAGLHVRPSPLIRHTIFHLGGHTRWLPWHLLHPGVWPSFPMLRRVRRMKPPDVSAREFLERGGYRGRARRIAEVALTGHLPGGLDEVGVLGLVADGVVNLETGLNHHVTEGYDRLPQAIAAGLDVRYGFAVDRIAWGPDGVRLRAGDGRELEARAGVCTLPVGVLAAGAVRFEPALPAGKRGALARLRMGPVAKVLLRFRERFWPRWAAQIACSDGPVTLYWPASYRIPDGPPVLIAYCTGPRAARLSEMSESEALDTVLADLARLFPRAAPREACVAHRIIDWSTDPFARGGYSFLLPGGAGARAELRAADTGALFWAGAATEWRPIAETVEAAYTSGLRAATEVASALGERVAARGRGAPAERISQAATTAARSGSVQ